MTTTPKISVIIPSYNQGAYLDEALRSVISQDYPALELIVIDGGSTDDCPAIIRRHEPHISYWCSEPDGGQTRGLIKGFERATGDIWCWLNSDDLLEPGTLAEVARFFHNHSDVDAVFGDATWIDRAGKVLKRQREIPFNRFIWLNTYDYVPSTSMFWRRWLYEAVGGLDPRFDLAMDADLWIRFAHAGPIAHVRRFWSRMRFHPAQKMQRLRERAQAEERAIRHRYLPPAHPATEQVRRTSARALRVAWKLVTGCYAGWRDLGRASA